MNNMEQSMDTIGQSGLVGKALRTDVDRRTMLKAAVAAGTIAGTWVAPRIESLGFAPAGASSATPCIRLSPSADDKQSQNNNNAFCSQGPVNCCGQSFGDAGKIDRFIFTAADLFTGCTEIVVRTIPLNCDTAGDPFGAPFQNGNPPQRNPSIGQFGVVIESTTGPNCGQCTILDAVLIKSSNREVIKSRNNGPLNCPPTGQIGNGIDASFLCSDTDITSSSRLAVRLTCNIAGDCPPIPT